MINWILFALTSYYLLVVFQSKIHRNLYTRWGLKLRGYSYGMKQASLAYEDEPIDDRIRVLRMIDGLLELMYLLLLIEIVVW